MSFKEIPVEECGINPFADLSKYCIVTAGNKEKCNSMLVTWGSFGVMWRKPTATIYIRQSRFTKTARTITRFPSSRFPTSRRKATWDPIPDATETSSKEAASPHASSVTKLPL